jgi:predicted RNA-binding Zn ribbon-like protein
MRKRQEAPGQLEQVRAFVNTVDLEQGTEELESEEGLRAWLVATGLGRPPVTVSAEDLRRALELREAIRAILLAHNGEAAVPAGPAAVLDETARRAGLRIRFEADGGTTIEPDSGGVDGALGTLLAAVHEAISDGTWERLKACREHTCEWAFYDHTKNRSGAWCNMQVCGNRAKARAYRERRAAQPQ